MGLKAARKDIREHMVFKGTHVLRFLIFGGLLTFFELTNRAEIFGSFTVDAIRNFLLLATAMALITAVALQREGRVPNVWRIWPYLLFVIWAGLSALWSTELLYTLREGSKLIYPILVYLLARCFLHSNPDRQQLFKILRQMLRVFVLLSALSSAAGVVLAIGRGAWTWGGSRVHKMPLAISPEVASVYVLLEIAGFQRIPGWRFRWWLVAVTLAYVLLSLTRAYIFGLIMAIAMLFWLSWRRWRWRLAAIGLCSVLILTILVVDNPVKRRMFWKPDQITAKSLILTAATDPGRLVAPDYIHTSGRFFLWQHLLSEARSRRPALIGSGLGSSRPIMAMSRWGKVVSHGDYAKYLAELGYVGIGLFMLLQGSWFLWSLRRSHDIRLSAVSRAAAVTLCAQLVLTVVFGLVYEVLYQAYDSSTIAVLLVAIIQSEVYARRSGGVKRTLTAAG